ncbi:hypothetical protein [Sandaracinus amylolyticus]|nr:hypothetical protein [Sandaracinus amylolyticus]
MLDGARPDAPMDREDACAPTTLYEDADGDGFGDAGSTAIAGAPAAIDFDYDCDGTEAAEIDRTAGNVEACWGDPSTCAIGFPGRWRGEVAPACGADGEVARCVVAECDAEWVPTRQRCR